jgi:general secretion pathway protein K
MQASWILVGALDWARLILREDARAGGPDHLGEPWSVPLQESRLSAFVAIDKDHADDTDQVFLSGQITDAQARMNVRNLVADGKISEPDQQAFSRLFEQLGLEPSEVDVVAANLVLALKPASDTGNDAPVPLLPRRLDQLRWLGLSEHSLLALSPHISMLPVRTTLNLNTAGPDAIAASMPGLDLTDAKRLVAARERAAFRTLADVAKALPADAAAPAATQFSVATRYFEVHGRLRIDQLVVDERSLVFRNGMEVSTLWRERATGDPALVPAAIR